MPNLSERDYLLWLANVKGITNHTANELLARFNSAEEIFKTPLSSKENGIKSIENFQGQKSVDKIYEIKEILAKESADFVTIADENYPNMLRHIYNRPVVLYYKGVLPDNILPCVCVTGTRKCSEYGYNAALVISRDLAACGVTVVAGLCEGVETAAHLGALEARGATSAVLPGGIDNCYPSSNKPLLEKIIASGGSAIAEYPPGIKLHRSHFRQRNRLMSGLCHSIVVTEARKDSGTNTTIKDALEQERNIFAVPGSIFSSLSTGTNHLLKTCAYPVTSYKDVLGILPGDLLEAVKLQAGHTDGHTKSAAGHTLGINTTALGSLSEDEKLLYANISLNIITIDELTAITETPVNKVLAALTALEFKGLVKRHPGQGYTRSI